MAAKDPIQDRTKILKRNLEKVKSEIDALERVMDFELDLGLGMRNPTITRREVDRALMECLIK